jgi:hypothetical protein
MPSPIAIGAVVVLAIIAIVYWRSKSQPGPPNCYSWTSYDPSTKKLPAGKIVGYDPGSSTIPAGALNPADNIWYLGLTAVSPSDMDWGLFVGSKAGGSGGDVLFMTSKMFVLMNSDNSACGSALPPKALASGGTPVKFNGTGVCWNFSKKSSAFSPASADGSCTQWGGVGEGPYIQIAKT